jgi:hypothetical protein
MDIDTSRHFMMIWEITYVIAFLNIRRAHRIIKIRNENTKFRFRISLDKLLNIR